MKRWLRLRARQPSVPVLVREIAPGDRNGLAEVFVAAFAAPPWNESWSRDLALAMIDEWRALPGFVGLVAVREEKIVGLTFGRIERWQRSLIFNLKELCVVPDCQNRGIATQLTAALERRLAEHGVARLYLETLRNSPASAFYARCGYRRDAAMVLMTKRLDRAGNR